MRTLIPLLLAACVALAACESSTNVSATANAPAGYSHVWLTVEQVWLHPSASAGPEDAGWLKFPLDPPQTIDLAAMAGGTQSQIASALKVPSGDYGQLRILLSGTDAPLTQAAQSAGALFNNEVDILDASGIEQRVPLQVANAAQGIGIAMPLEVPDASKQILAALGGSSGTSGTTATTSGTATTFSDTGLPTSGSASAGLSGQLPATGSTGAGSATASSSAQTTTAAAPRTAVPGSAAIAFDPTRDLVPTLFSGQPGVLFNPHLTGADLARVGTIQGQLDVGGLVASAIASGGLDVEVAAQTLSDDGSRHVVVRNARVQSDGTFVLFPLSTADGTPTSYDLVIHGPQVQTVVVKSVPVSAGNQGAAAGVALGALTLTPSASFNVNVAEGSGVSPRGARVGFFQTLPGFGEVPYLIEEFPLDPFTGRFEADRPLSAADIESGTFVSGQSLALETTPPIEGPAAYRVAAAAAPFGEGAFGPTVSPGGAGTGAATFTVTAPAMPPTAVAAAVTATVNVVSPGKYDRGGLIITHDGAIVTLASLDAVLEQAQSAATMSVELPGGSVAQPFNAGLYYAEGWVWNSADPAGTFSRQAASAPLDLRSASTGSIAIDIR